MGTLAHIRINTTQGFVLYGEFIIQEVEGGWEWASSDYTEGGFAPTLFDCIDLIADMEGES